MRSIPYGRQTITDADIASVVEVLRSDFLTQGPTIARFEEAFAHYIGSKYAVAVANGTAALHLAALALGTKSGSRVITTPITFSASANCVLYCGGSVDFVDIDPSTLTLDFDKTRKLLASHPKGTFSGLIPVAMAGMPLRLDLFRELAEEYSLWILEDACHAPGARFLAKDQQWHRSGDCAFAEIGIFSFHPVKHIACGEGGMITCASKEIYERLLLLRTHGITKDPQKMLHPEGAWYYEMQELGYNYRLTDIQAALGLSQLQRADQGLLRRRELAQRYEVAFANTKIHTHPAPVGLEHAYHLYVVQVQKRKEVFDALKLKDIHCQVHYLPVHLMPYYKKYGWKRGDFPEAEKYYEHCLSLPMYPDLSNQEQDFVIRTILNAVS